MITPPNILFCLLILLAGCTTTQTNAFWERVNEVQIENPIYFR